MNAGLLGRERIEASGKASRRVPAADSCPVSFSPTSSNASISSVTTWGRNGGKFVEIEVDDGLQGDDGGRVLEPLRESIEPSCVVEQLGDGIQPTLKPGPPVGGTPIPDSR
jgi:hypothetical protein